MNPELIEKLAEAAHDVWMAGRIRDGWSYGEIYNKEQKKNPCIVPYDQMIEADKQSDRDLAIGIPKILEKAGFTIVKV